MSFIRRFHCTQLPGKCAGHAQSNLSSLQGLSVEPLLQVYLWREKVASWWDKLLLHICIIIISLVSYCIYTCNIIGTVKFTMFVDMYK